MSIYTDTRVKALDGIVVDLERRISALEKEMLRLDIFAPGGNNNAQQSPDDKKPKAKKWTRENSVL